MNAKPSKKTWEYPACVFDDRAIASSYSAQVIPRLRVCIFSKSYKCDISSRMIVSHKLLLRPATSRLYLFRNLLLQKNAVQSILFCCFGIFGGKRKCICAPRIKCWSTCWTSSVSQRRNTSFQSASQPEAHCPWIAS